MDLNKTSKFLSLILRHKPEVIGIALDEHGWANVNELITKINDNSDIREFNRAALEYIVKTDNKQRYSFNEDKTLIRANQGHSIPVDVELTEKIPPDILYHGTGKKYVTSIDAQGLLHKSRLYVHLSSDTVTAKAVGMRHGEPVKNPDLWKRLLKAIEDGNHSVKFVWIKGHAGHEFNERCDQLATEAADGNDLIEDENYGGN